MNNIKPEDIKKLKELKEKLLKEKQTIRK